MPVLLSARAARLAAKLCRDAALTAEHRASRANGAARADYLDTARQCEALAELFDRHWRARRPKA